MTPHLATRHQGISERALGFAAGVEAAARIAEDYWTGIIRCSKTNAPIEHVRLHVEHQWSAEVARRIRALTPGDPLAPQQAAAGE